MKPFQCTWCKKQFDDRRPRSWEKLPFCGGDCIYAHAQAGNAREAMDKKKLEAFPDLLGACKYALSNWSNRFAGDKAIPDKLRAAIDRAEGQP